MKREEPAGTGSTPNSNAPQIVFEDADGEQLQIPIPPADGLSLGEWMETLPKDTQYRARLLAA
jgi:hypothetical protein